MNHITLIKRLPLALLLPFLWIMFTAYTCADMPASSAPNDYQTIAYNEAVNANIPPDLFVKQIQVESGFNPSAVSYAGAIGIAQFMPETAKGLGVNPWDPYQSLRESARLMGRYVAIYGSYSRALAAYNCGSGCLQKAMRNCLNFYWCVPAETRRYIDLITG